MVAAIAGRGQRRRPEEVTPGKDEPSEEVSGEDSAGGDPRKGPEEALRVYKWGF